MLCTKILKKYQQHPVFPGGHPSKYYPGPTMLNFGDRTRTGVFIVCTKIQQKYQQHPVFPGGHPSKYYPGPTMLNFGDRTRTGVFIVVWPLAIT
ncbi:hypothetical protein J437_LFUL004268 [Ladona fulva]|uniref:Uncharacterized protein n=1 Tax=Ladona fulva TaxID=123851 RepID=A0A8K0P4Q6_LADFU|nr:hypothetical protein J437_LFUL004268 [Ladona fulva]